MKAVVNQEIRWFGVNNFLKNERNRNFVFKIFAHFKKKKMKKLINWVLNPPVTGASSILLIRLMAGTVFFFEGILKFVYTNQGAGRFAKLGFPFSETTAHFVAIAEITGGLLLLFGLITRVVSFYFIVQMIVAVLSTKISLYYGTSPLPLPPAPPKIGIWAVEHESRSDYAQILTCLFLFIEGAGRLSLDFILKTGKKIYSYKSATI